MPVVFDAAGDVHDIQLDVATAFYRICEEALRNIQKHAGDVPVSVHIQADSCELRLQIHDDGRGFDPDGLDAVWHLGLVSMRERAILVGPVRKCTSHPEKGTTILIWLVK